MGDCAARVAGGSESPIVEGIPVLLEGTEDEVSKAVSAFYRGAWKRTAEALPGSPVLHDDISPYGHRYVRETENRFRSVFQRRGRAMRFFLDAGCGSFPRVAFGENHAYHVCIDFCLEGLMESRRVLGERAVCVCGSLLRAPLRDAVFDGVLASHSIYHIDKDLQATAIRELLRVLAPGGRLVIFYANPDNASSRILELRRFWPLRALLAFSRRSTPPPPLVTDDAPLYCYLHPVEVMLRELTSVYQDIRISVKPLCLFHFDERAPLFQRRRLAALSYFTCMGLERSTSTAPTCPTTSRTSPSAHRSSRRAGTRRCSRLQRPGGNRPAFCPRVPDASQTSGKGAARTPGLGIGGCGASA